MRTYYCPATWGGHGLNRNHGYSNATYASDSAYPDWQAGYRSSRFHVTAWTFDTSEPRAAVAGGAIVQEMYMVVRMSQLRAYTIWSLAYKFNDQTDGLAGTFSRGKRTDQSVLYSAYGDYLALVRTGNYGCTVLEEGTNDNITPDWLIRIDITTTSVIPIYGLTISSSNSSTTSRYYSFPTGDYSEAALFIVTDEEPPPPPPPTPAGDWTEMTALIYDGTRWVEKTPMVFDGREWRTVTPEIYKQQIISALSIKR